MTWHFVWDVYIHTELAMELCTAPLRIRALAVGTPLCYRFLGALHFLLFSSLRARNHVPAIVIDPQRLFAAPSRDGSVETHLFLIASLRPILLALFTASARFTLPIWRRFILDGFGSFIIHSGTVDPDWSKTFAILGGKSAFARWHGSRCVTRATTLDDTRNTYVLRNGASSSVKYVTAFPSLPARPVRPTRSMHVRIAPQTCVDQGTSGVYAAHRSDGRSSAHSVGSHS